MARNLLLNGDFHAPFVTRMVETISVAESWSPWWLSAAEDDPEWRDARPIFRQVVLDNEPAQELSTPYATHTAGMWQQVPAFNRETYELQAEALAWSSEGDLPESRHNHANVEMAVGIDPTGGMDPESPNIVWGKVERPLRRWQSVRVKATAQNNIITVFLKSSQDIPKKHQSSLWRDIALAHLGEYRRLRSIVGPADTHIIFEPEEPQFGDEIIITCRSMELLDDFMLRVSSEDDSWQTIPLDFIGQADGHYQWQSGLNLSTRGTYDFRLVQSEGARLLAQRLLRIQPIGSVEDSTEITRAEYRRVYVLLPPTADLNWFVAAARGAFPGRYTVGFSADDAGDGSASSRLIIALNPHHWPDPLTEAWFARNYPGSSYLPIVATTPREFEAWLQRWIPTPGL
jgi:hypothetical protein